MALANSGALFINPIGQPLSAGPSPPVGTVLSGSSYVFYQSGTTTPVPVYADGGLNVSLGNVIAPNASGQFGAFYLDPSITYRWQEWSLPNGTGVKLWDVDPYVPTPVGALRLSASVPGLIGITSTALQSILSFPTVPVGSYMLDGVFSFYGVVSGSQGIFFQATGTATFANQVTGVATGLVPSSTPVTVPFNIATPIDFTAIDLGPGPPVSSLIMRCGFDVVSPGSIIWQASPNSSVPGSAIFVGGSMALTRVG